MDIPDGLLAGFAAVLGLIFGSFGTVVAYRLPLGETVVTGRSKCPNCGHTITAMENVPLFSYLFLRGRCRNCGNKISIRYPAIEVVTALLFALAALKFGLTVEGAAYAGLFWTLVVLSVIDLEEKKLPDKITLPLFVVGLVALAAAALVNGGLGDFSPDLVVAAVLVLGMTAFMFWPDGDDPSKTDEEPGPRDEDDTTPKKPKRVRISPWGLLVLVGWMVLIGFAFVEGERGSFTGAILGAAVFAGFFFAVALAVEGGMGGGDVKLALTLGAFSGYLGAPGNVLVAMFASILLGGIISLVALGGGKNRKTELPFGPFLALGTVVAVFVGERVQDFYGSTF